MIKSFYHPPENLKEDIEIYKSEIESYLKGDIPFKVFRGKRVVRGVYEQRTDNTFMMRVRIPAGGITPVQMEKLSEISKKRGNGILHVTTRQDIQIHWVGLKDTPKCMSELLEVGLTCRGGGGNTLRNVTACFDAGVCEKESFDVAPYNIALTERLIKNPMSFGLPRKFKIAFSGCGDDCAFATVNDLGFIAAHRTENGKKEQGFRVYVAGGMGASSKVAEKLENFIPAEEAGNVAEAVMRLFDKHGNRKRKHKARLRFLFNKLGREEFIKLYKDQLEKVKSEGGIKLDLREIPASSENSKASLDSSENKEDENYQMWLSQNLSPQKQKDFFYVTIFMELGHIPAEKMIRLANVVRKFREGTMRSTQDQNFVIRWVHKSELNYLYNELKKIDLNRTGVKTVEDISVCAGASTCRPGICLSRGLASALNKKFTDNRESLQPISNLKINISGCPNACGQDPIGQIGLFGAARRIGERMIPYYMITLGGRVEEGKTVFGERIDIAPSKAIPTILLKFLLDYKANAGNEDYYKYIASRGKTVLKEIIKEHQTVPAFEENKDYYFDWGSEEEFSLSGRGEGECGAGIFDMMEVDLKDAKNAIADAEKILSDNKNPAAKLFSAISHSSRALLVTRGVEARDDLEAFAHFEEIFINQEKVVDAKFIDLLNMAAEYQSGDLGDDDFAKYHEAIKELTITVADLYESMDDSLQFKTMKEQKKEKEKSNGRLLDLKGVKCPFNYVKAKLQLETMETGDLIELFLDDGEPIKNVPNSLKNDGQEILEMEKTGTGHYRLLVKKKV
tara:strand:- start:6510 stop:8888 length:2379 start_codon:yes stop_codon:yes gene_type:complete